MRQANPSVLLYCFAPAGSSGSVFRDWQSSFPTNIQVRPVELPGRGKRMGMPQMEDYRSLVLALTREIAQDITSAQRFGGKVQYAGFGHGAGAVLNFAVCTRLSERLRQAPAHCFLSAGLPLHIERKKLSTLGDAELAEEMRVLSEAQQDILNSPDMLNFFLPIFRADCAAYEESVLDKRRVLDCPLTLFAGEGDAFVPPDIMWSWNRNSTCMTHNVILRGDHRTMLQEPEEMIGHIRSAIDYAHLQRSALTA